MPAPASERCPQLLSLAAHEFRTPAGVVGGYLRMLQRDADAPLSERQRKMVAEAEKSCMRLVALVAELSDIGKLDSGDLPLARQPLDAFALIEEVAVHVDEGKDRGVQLAVRGDASGAPMTGDPGRLRGAFDAVFRAILREKVGPCEVVADRRRDVIDGRACALLVVAQEGTVEATYRAPPAGFDENRAGLGLALPLARRVIEAHGGRVWSPSTDEALARGSVVVTLPI